MSKRTTEEMFPLMEKWESSGESREVFCDVHGISIATFGYWRGKYLKSKKKKKKGVVAGFVELRPERSVKLEVVYPNGVRVVVPEGVPVADLRSLIALY